MGTDPEKIITEKDACTPMFTEALFVVARTWKQTKPSSTDEWIKKPWYMYTMEYYSIMKSNAFESVPMTWMKRKAIIPCEVSQRKAKITY